MGSYAQAETTNDTLAGATEGPATTSMGAAMPLHAAGAVLALQRSIGNQATAGLLRSYGSASPARTTPAAGRQMVQRTFAGCEALTNDPQAVSLLAGSVVHRLIESHFLSTVPGARKLMIPGASASPQRSEGICGDDTTVIPPQALGGAAGAGFPDLARVTPSGIAQVAEIKPAAAPCLVDGEEQLLRYIDQGNARDDAQSAWRAAQGVTVVTPMPESAYAPPELSTPIADIRTAWCTPGLMAYSVRPRGPRIPVPPPVVVSKSEREETREQYRDSAGDRIPAAAAAAVATGVAVVAGRALWRHFWRAVATRFALRGA